MIDNGELVVLSKQIIAVLVEAHCLKIRIALENLY